MEFLDAGRVVDATPWGELIDAIGAELAAGNSVAPQRHVHDVPMVDGSTGALLLMPAWTAGELIATKVVTFFPSNAGTVVPTVNAAVLLFDGRDGRHVATIDGDELTARRTAAISALASRHLARPDSSRLLVVGTGSLAPNVARAHSHVLPISTIEVWGRSADKAAAVAERLASEGFDARVATDLSQAVAQADLISCVTAATSPLINGDWLAPGAHLDLIGGFQHEMRESDDRAVERADVFVDTVSGATLAGDLSQPIADGWFSADDIVADLATLARGDHAGRTSNDQITLFKSAGFAVADLAAARLALRNATSAG
ncbi:MAG: ornithine cyclodeaminase family protein [Acidimicrobiales bacterium]